MKNPNKRTNKETDRQINKQTNRPTIAQKHKQKTAIWNAWCEPSLYQKDPIQVKPIGVSVITQSLWSIYFRMNTNQNWTCSWTQRPTCWGWKPWKNIVDHSATWRSLYWAVRRTSWAGWPQRWSWTALKSRRTLREGVKERSWQS